MGLQVKKLAFVIIFVDHYQGISRPGPERTPAHWCRAGGLPHPFLGAIASVRPPTADLRFSTLLGFGQGKLVRRIHPFRIVKNIVEL